MNIKGIGVILASAVVLVGCGDTQPVYDRTGAEMGRRFDNTGQPIWYIKDPRTDLCFAETGQSMDSRSYAFAAVQCTEKVKRAIEADRGHEW